MNSNVCTPVAERPQPGRGNRQTEVGQEGKLAEAGFFRNREEDSELFWFFGFDWWKHVVPLLDQQGQLSIWQLQKVLEMLKSRERIFEFNLAELSADQQERLRRRYLLVQEFFKKAIEEKTPIYARV